MGSAQRGRGSPDVRVYNPRDLTVGEVAPITET